MGRVPTIAYDEAKARRSQGVRLAGVLGALSHALDLTEGQPEGHCVRCTYIGLTIGREIGLPTEALSDLYYTILMKDLGCSSNAARICSLYLADDLAFKRDFKEIDGSLSAALRFVLRHTGMQAGMAERFRAIIHILRNGGDIARELIETRCRRGAEIARRLRFSEAVQQGILDLDEHWDGGGKPEGLTGSAIHLFARIALLAQVVDVFRTGEGPAAAIAEARNRAGSWFDPDLVAALERVASRPGFWDTLASDDLGPQVFDLEPSQAIRTVDDDYLDDIADAFSEVVDAKSPFTAGHSRRVAVFADMVAEELALTPEHRRWLKRAALLHDIGKLGVSNSILDKQGRPTDEEWVALKRHAALTEAVLSRVSVFADMAATAAAHHERLDGRGYPRGLSGEAISLESRILMVADIFDALTADRPFRAAMPVSRALAILHEDVGTAVDPECLSALERGLARLSAAAA
jgi:HD-GYP domain-containing protein (c-di-GMP phosphodiesterase class II)